MTGLTREMILALQQQAPPLQLEAVACPEWGQEAVVYVRMMTAATAEVYERSMYRTNRSILDALEALSPSGDATVAPTMDREDAEAQLETAPSIRIALVIQTACDAEGQPLFTLADEQWLSTQPAPVIKRVFDAAWRVNAFGAEAVETEKKDSESMLTPSFATDSHSNSVARSAN